MNYVMRRLTNMKFIAVSLLSVTLLSYCRCDQKEDSDTYFSRFVADLWLEGADVVKIIWRDCSKKLMDVKDVIDHKEYFPKFMRCMKRKTLRALDRSLTPDVVPLADGINLVRFELVDRSGNVMLENGTSSWTEKELEEGEWRTLALQRMAKVLRTHVIKFDFDEGKTSEKVEYRGRRRHQMMTMMMFGVVSIGMVIIPMGFQFLAVLGGKALLLAKMALVLASIQGLKKVNLGYDGFHDRGKIATNPLNYGFYHSYPPAPYDHYEKRSHDSWPTTFTPTTSLAKSMLPWANLETGDIKVDRIHLSAKDMRRPENDVKMETKQTSESRMYPVYLGAETSPPIFTSLDSPTHLPDLTTTPGEVQADFALDLPYNGFRFQTPTPVVSA